MSHSQPRPLKHDLQFLRAVILRFRSVGAVAPSSPSLARAMAREVDPQLSGRVLELGPGTGAITAALVARGIIPERILAIERDVDFTRLLRKTFSGIEVVAGDAFALNQSLPETCRSGFAAIVSSLPLLNHSPQRRAEFLSDMLGRLARGAPLVQFSYGLSMPVRPPPGAVATRAAFVWRNLPPAHVWVYRRA